ncbi:glycoside hydrolase family 72 protein [Macroventuria anomochaeta]|uniref:Glycoside hydrolase family 72 protein n=1 Tax=Macroventuria anomochaeta TaxID=301207 RepID=A0ACB6SFP3_9PLEO|nr:glycoside hydrolase family 72 protein [Macroventuria anomochaeta]KAF2632425.1 glycoside hydrolase family 72 protein [Macroventuria anomochaeta]
MTNPTASVPITIRGRYLWRGDERFFVRGVAYQVPDMQDPISDARLPQLKHDISLFKELGLNTLFVYHVDDIKSHDQAMKMLEEAGIYVLTTITTRFNAINRLDPYKSYHRPAMNEFFQTGNFMAQYPNTLGLLVGLSLVNSKDTEKAAPRYMKLQNEACGQRILPIGYNATTVNQRDMMILDYLSLGDAGSSIDFWTCNCYIWAGKSNMQVSGYEALLARLQTAAIPIVMSEYGTNIPNPRLFQETAALYSPRMSQVFSGGCAYEFWHGSNSYGLVELVRQEQARSSPAWAVEQRRERALARSDDITKTAEKRETERGILSVFHDFVNYKKNLDATRDIESNWEGEVMEREAAERGNVDTTQLNWPWEPEFQIPDTVVDWAETEDLVNGKGLVYAM